MRLRRLATHDEEINDKNNGRNHELAFVNIIEKKGTLDESMLLQESYAPGVIGKMKPKGVKGLMMSLPTALRGIKAGKMRSLTKLIPGVHHKLPDDAQDHVKKIYERAEESRQQFNIYITGTDDELSEGEENIEPEPDETEALS